MHSFLGSRGAQTSLGPLFCLKIFFTITVRKSTPEYKGFIELIFAKNCIRGFGPGHAHTNLIGVAPITQVTQIRTKIVTFKGGHLMW